MFKQILSHNLQMFFFFTEAHIYKNQTELYSLPTYQHIIKPQDRNNSHGLACYIKRNMQCPEIPLPDVTSLETLGVELIIPNSTLTFIVIYKPPKVTMADLLRDLQIILKAIDNVQKTIILGDFNVDALAAESQPLKHLMQQFTFKFTHPGTTHNHGSCLDHVYLPKDIQNMYNCYTFLPTYFSDHFYVHLQLGISA
ncbi:hypothetical protein DPMN_026952 [Dreissena polymorpha]|uniref:Endonuclease/exonuclease/phosphatase domain-containing protein n=1 Tax=Dreissena polymorpha TaxID=45954 RepID=A0A9D4LUC5_DREPO|nr:hypothetical protein DPMN_026952 [Dreissena polymorpha]